MVRSRPLPGMRDKLDTRLRSSVGQSASLSRRKSWVQVPSESQRQKERKLRIITHIAYATVIAGLIVVVPSVASPVQTTATVISPANVNSELQCFEVVHEDRSAEKTDGTNRERFFSIDRAISGSSTMEDPTPERSWDGRVSQCDSLSGWSDFERCMWFPWEYGF